MTEIRVDEETVLRRVTQDDAEALFHLVDANRAYLRAWLPWLDSNRSVGDIRSFIRESHEREKRGRGLVLLVLHCDELCGVVGFNWIDAANRSCEIGYWLSEDLQGRGIMTRCVRALIEHAFRSLQINRINIPVAMGNVRSRAIPERLGFAQEGIRREAEWLYDRYVDHVVYALLRRDFEGKERP